MTIVYTIGFGGKKPGTFLEVLDAVGIKTLADIRLWCVARFVPWASGANLEKILGPRYRYIPELAPTKELLSAYKEGQIDWTGYEKIFTWQMRRAKLKICLPLPRLALPDTPSPAKGNFH